MRLQSERDKVAHLLRRFGLGASESELDYYAEGGYRKAVDRLINFESAEDGFGVELEAFSINNPQGVAVVPMPGVKAWWTLRLMSTRRPLQEKLTLFWHDHFATSASKVTLPPFMFGQNETLRSHCLGNFGELLEAASKDPAMLFWLDNQFNVKGKPNENFAREVMELFTLGIGHYNEEDVQEASRAFTGWNYTRGLNGPRFAFRRLQHDTGEKSVLGKKGNLSGEDVLDLLANHPQTARYITTKLWEWFAYPEPEPALVDRLATVFKDSKLSIKTLIEAMMTSPEFLSDKAVRAIYKNPADFVMPLVRQLGLGEQTVSQFRTSGQAGLLARGPVRMTSEAMKGMGMDLLFPPDVNGWEGGQAWITSATMVERIGFADRLFGVAQNNRGQVRFNAMFLFSEDPTSKGVVNRLISIFDAPIAENTIGALIDAAEKASGGRLTAQNANRTAAQVSRLIFGSPEFQFC